MHRGLTSHSMPKHNFHAPIVKRFPEDIQCIIRGRGYESGSLYISNIEAAQSPATLRKHNIKAVLSCAKGYELKHQKHVVNNYMYVPAIDHQSFDISIYFDKAVDFITQHLKRTNVLVHCIAGVSRSVSMVIAYFMREHNLDFEDAYRTVKSQRHIINPNSGFIEHLKNYRRQLSLRASKNLQYSNFSSSPRRVQTQTYISPPKEDKVTAATTNDIYLRQELPAGPHAYQNKYAPFSISTHRNEFTPNSKNYKDTSTSSKSMMKSSVMLYEQKYADMPLQRTTTAKPLKRELQTYNTLNTELEEKIKKIREKYDAQRTVLQEKFQSSRKKSDYESKKAYQQTKYSNEYIPKQPKYSKLKTEDVDSQAQHRRYMNSTSGYSTRIEELFPKRFYNEYNEELRRASPRKDIYTATARNNYLQRSTQGLSNQKYRTNDSYSFRRYQTPVTYMHDHDSYRVKTRGYQ